jgi:hypothetical protein
MSKIIWSVVPSWRTSPLTSVTIRNRSRSTESGDTMTGPTGPNVSNDFPQSDDVIPGVAGFDVLAAGADHDDELALVVDGIAAQLDVGSGADQARGELGEHQWVGRHLHAALVGMGLVVEADGVDVSWAGDGRAETLGLDGTARFVPIELGGQRRQTLGHRQGRHGVRAELTARHRLEVVPLAVSHQGGSAFDVGE